MSPIRRSDAQVCTVVLNWNQPQMTARCVQSVLMQEIAGGNDLVVIDNGSALENRTELDERLPSQVPLIQNSQNLGFAGGMNVGIEYALGHGYRYIWLLNNDAFPEAGCLEALVAAMERDASLGAVTPQLKYADGRKQIVGARINWMTGAQEYLFGGELPYPTPVGVCAIGTALLLRTEVLRQVGVLDERFFAYREEDDLCIRIVLATGGNIADVPEAHCVHLESVTSGGSESAFVRFLLARNGLLILAKHLRRRWMIPAYLRALAENVRTAAWLARRNPGASAGVLAGIWAAHCRQYGPPARLNPPGWLQWIVMTKGWGIARFLEFIATVIAPRADRANPRFRDPAQAANRRDDADRTSWHGSSLRQERRDLTRTGELPAESLNQPAMDARNGTKIASTAASLCRTLPE